MALSDVVQSPTGLVSSGNVATFNTPAFASAPSIGNTDLIFAVSSSTIPTPSGYTLDESNTGFAGIYIFRRTVQVGDTGAAVTLTITSTRPCAAFRLELSGTATVSGSSNKNFSGTTTTARSANPVTIGAQGIIVFGTDGTSIVGNWSAWNNSIVQLKANAPSGGTVPCNGVVAYGQPGPYLGTFTPAATSTVSSIRYQVLVVGYLFSAPVIPLDPTPALVRQMRAPLRPQAIRPSRKLIEVVQAQAAPPPNPDINFTMSSPKRIRGLMMSKPGQIRSWDAPPTVDPIVARAVSRTRVFPKLKRHTAAETVLPIASPIIQPRRALRPLVRRAVRRSEVVTTQTTPQNPAIVFSPSQIRRVRGLLRRQARKSEVVQPQAAPPNPPIVFSPSQPRRLRGALQRQVKHTETVRPQVNPLFNFMTIVQPRRIRGLLVRQVKHTEATPPQAQPITENAQARRPRGFQQRQVKKAEVIQPQVVIQPNIVFAPSQVRRLRGILQRQVKKTETVTPQQNPIFAREAIRQPRRPRGLLPRQVKRSETVRPQVNPPFNFPEIKQPRRLRGLLFRITGGRTRPVVPAQVVFPGTDVEFWVGPLGTRWDMRLPYVEWYVGPMISEWNAGLPFTEWDFGMLGNRWDMGPPRI